MTTPEKPLTIEQKQYLEKECLTACEATFRRMAPEILPEGTPLEISNEAEKVMIYLLERFDVSKITIPENVDYNKELKKQFLSYYAARLNLSRI